MWYKNMDLSDLCEVLEMKLTKRKLDYKWIILAVAFTMVFVCLGFCSGNKGLYLTAITDALGIKRSLFSINDSCRYIATALINMFFGSLLYRFGMRKMVGFGFVALIASMLVYAFAESVFVFCIGGFLLGVGLAFTTTTIASSLVRRWFSKNIGRYTGIVFAANGIGGAVAAQIVSPMINNPEDPFGYRTSYLVVAAILFVTGVVVTLLLREHPPKPRLAQEKTCVKKARSVNWTGIDFAVVKRCPWFYLAALTVFLTGFILQGITGIYAAHLRDVGMKPEFVATVVSVFSLCLTGTKLLVGALYDKVGLRPVMLLCQGFTVVSLILLAVLNNSGLGMVLAIVFAVLYALALPLETLVVPLIVNELFGAASYDKLLGIMTAMNYLGYALGAPIINLLYDVLGSYYLALLLFGGAMIPVSIVFQFVIKAAKKTAAQLNAVK